MLKLADALQKNGKMILDAAKIQISDGLMQIVGTRIDLSKIDLFKYD